MWVAFANAKATHIISAKILANMPYLVISFNNMLINDIASFEQLGPDIFHRSLEKSYAVVTHLKCFTVASLMSTDKICFHGEINNLLQLNLIIFASLISNNRASRSETLVPFLTN